MEKGIIRSDPGTPISLTRCPTRPVRHFGQPRPDDVGIGHRRPSLQGGALAAVALVEDDQHLPSGVIKHGNGKYTIYAADFPIESPFSSGFPIATLDYYLGFQIWGPT